MIRPSNRASIRNISDYSPFGVQLSERTISGDGYRFGFNGKENDSEVSGEGNSYDFGARMYNSRIGRWLSCDAKAAKQPSQSPYKAFLNNPIVYVDPDGNTEYETVVIYDAKGTLLFKGYKEVSSNLMSGGKTAFNSTFDKSYGYDYRHISVFRIQSDGSIKKMSKKTEILYQNGVKDVETYGFAKEEGDVYNCDIPFLEGNGGTQKDGYTLTSYEGGVSQTKQKSLSAAEEIEIGEFLDVLGALKNGSLGNKYADMVNDIKGMYEDYENIKELNEISGSSSDGIPGNSQTMSNTMTWVQDTDGNWSGSGDFATEKERITGDTLKKTVPAKNQHLNKNGDTIQGKPKI
jgi:RHS repeat-associated protein